MWTVTLLFVCALTSLAAEPTKMDRQRVIAHFEMTERWLVDEVKGLSEAQRNFRPNEKAWNVLDCVEHLAIAEPQYWADYQKAMKEAIKPNFKSQADDPYILWYGIDRTARTKTGEERVPNSRYKDFATPLGEFSKLRATMRDYAKTTKEDWRGHDCQGGDGYQWFLMISTHCQRHILQIREIKADANFPKQ